MSIQNQKKLFKNESWAKFMTEQQKHWTLVRGNSPKRKKKNI